MKVPHLAVQLPNAVPSARRSTALAWEPARAPVSPREGAGTVSARVARGYVSEGGSIDSRSPIEHLDSDSPERSIALATDVYRREPAAVSPPDESPSRAWLPEYDEVCDTHELAAYAAGHPPAASEAFMYANTIPTVAERGGSVSAAAAAKPRSTDWRDAGHSGMHSGVVPVLLRPNEEHLRAFDMRHRWLLRDINGEVSVGELVLRTGFEVREVTQLLAELEERGVIALG